jgi:hypothetical protein
MDILKFIVIAMFLPLSLEASPLVYDFEGTYGLDDPIQVEFSLVLDFEEHGLMAHSSGINAILGDGFFYACLLEGTFMPNEGDIYDYFGTTKPFNSPIQEDAGLLSVGSDKNNISFWTDPYPMDWLVGQEVNLCLNGFGLDVGPKGLVTLTNISSASVPEPSTILLLVSGMAGLGFLRRKDKRKN